MGIPIRPGQYRPFQARMGMGPVGWAGAVEALGLCPKPHEGAALRSRQGWALEAIYWGRNEGGPTRMLQRLGWPSLIPTPTDRGPGAEALVGSKGKALVGSGAKPRCFSFLSPIAQGINPAPPGGLRPGNGPTAVP